MGLSIANQAVREAYKRGFRVTRGGDLLSPSGERRKLTIEGKHRGKPYYRISIRLKNVPGDPRKNLKVHRLQAYQKFGDKIFDKSVQVRHYNDNSLDNSWDNIILGSAGDNLKDRHRNKRVQEELNKAPF